MKSRDEGSDSIATRIAALTADCGASAGTIRCFDSGNSNAIR